MADVVDDGDERKAHGVTAFRSREPPNVEGGELAKSNRLLELWLRRATCGGAAPLGTSRTCLP